MVTRENSNVGMHSVGAGSGSVLIPVVALAALVMVSASFAMLSTSGNANTTASHWTMTSIEPNVVIAQREMMSSASKEGKARYPITIRKPEGPPRSDTGVIDQQGERIQVACSNCHATRHPNLLNRTSADLDEFHLGLGMTHGNLTCVACHRASNYDQLHLADGSPLEFQDVMSLCSQCHGTQRRDFDRGVHGGMSGYWDTRRGPRLRNNCVDCHHPHQPQFPKMIPMFKPRDRFLENQPEVRHD